MMAEREFKTPEGERRKARERMRLRRRNGDAYGLAYNRAMRRLKAKHIHEFRAFVEEELRKSDAQA